MKMKTTKTNPTNKTNSTNSTNETNRTNLANIEAFMKAIRCSNDNSAKNQNISFRAMLRIAFILLLFLYPLASSALADPVVISTNTTISATNTSFDNQDITVSGCTLTIDGAHQFQSLSIINGGKITHIANSTTQTNILDLNITNDVTIDTGASIDASGCGFTTDQGPGKGSATFYGGGGGGHGGNGGYCYNNYSATGISPGGVEYDSITNPSQIGSGGGYGRSGGRLGGNGGGGIRLNVGGRLENRGKILSNGNNGVGSFDMSSGGGSGGFIYLTVGDFAGVGEISANGGIGGSPSSGGGGAGGRIAIFYNTKTYTGATTAYGGTGYQNGSAGSIYLKSKISTEGQIIFDNSVNTVASTSIVGDFPDILIRNSVVIVAGNVTAISCTVSNNAVLTHSQNTDVQTNIIDMAVSGNMTVESSGLINASGLGFLRDQGNGKGLSGYYGGGGGAHGGNGGNGTSNTGGVSYDSVTDPSQIGSGGGSGSNGDRLGGNGGGGIRLSVSGRLENNGIIRANGNNGVGGGSVYCGGGGAGGFINLTVGELTGVGSISANGGIGGITGSNGGGGGAGGRIAIYYNSKSYTGTVTTYGGTGYQNGASGSVYIKSNADANGEVIYDNNQNYGAYTYISGTLPNITIRNKTMVVATGTITATSCIVSNNSILTHGINSNNQEYIVDMVVSGNFIIETGGLIDANSRGYTSGQGSGKGGSGYYGGGGGAHGGNGGNGTSNTGGVSYDSVTDPSQIGSGGGSGSNGDRLGGNGGGGIRLSVSGRLENNGIIRANGNNGVGGGSVYCGGGGAGGFINLTVGELTGVGSISANGGIGGITGSSGGGGGAGGRIAIYYHSAHPASTFNMANVAVVSGTGYQNGQPGTIYIPEVATPVITTNNGQDFSTGNIALTLTGTCLADAAVILVNGSADGVTHGPGTTSWSYSTNLTEGANTFSVVAQNGMGLQSGAAVITVTLNSTPPGAPVITTNSGGDFTVQTAQVQLQGTCTADSNAILVNGSAEGVTYTPGATTWSYSGELAVGANFFSVMAMNAAGQQSPADTITVTFANTVPDQPANVSPADGAVNVNQPVLLTASAYSDAEGDVHAAGQWQVRAQNGTFDTPVFNLVSGAGLIQATVPVGTLNWSATYYFHVRYKDSRGSWSAWSNETSFTTTADNLAPENVANLRVTASQENALVLTWNHSVDSAGDLASYKIYRDGNAVTTIAKEQNTHTLDGLAPATGYVVKVTSLDQSGNESSGATINAATLLNNPVNVQAHTGATRVSLSWDPASPAGLVKQYNVYIGASPFAGIAGLTPVATVTGTAADITGLTANQDYYFAVATVNISDGVKTAVTSIQATPVSRLTAHYTMDGMVGDQIYDETGVHTATVYGSAMIVPGYEGNALDLNGVDDWLGVDSLSLDLKTGDNITLTCWFKTTAAKTNDTSNILFASNNDAQGDLFRLGTGNSGGIYHAVGASGGEYGTGFNNGAWHYLALVQSGSGAYKIYVDNQLIRSATATAAAWSNAVFHSIGQEWDTTGPSDFFDGRIDDFRIYNYALTEAEIAALYVDNLPPELSSAVPADGSLVNLVNDIRLTLLDRQGAIDTVATAATMVVTNHQAQTLTGSVTVSGSTFIFTPDAAPLADGIYQIALTAFDMEGNSQAYAIAFTVDSEVPNAPTITGGTVTSGLIQVAPVINRSSSKTVTLTGTREADTSIWINGVQKTAVGSGDWSVALTLTEGENSLSVSMQDQAGNESAAVTVIIQVDSIAPAVSDMTPAHNSYINFGPADIILNLAETGSGLDLPGSTLAVRDNSLAFVPGDWQLTGSQLVFTPQVLLGDSVYTVTLQLKDLTGNQTGLLQYQFTLDRVAPAAPVINPVTSPTYNPGQTVSGTREAYSAILLNGTEVLGNVSGTSFQHTITLASGTNTLNFTARDRAGNLSQPATVTIVYDDVAPLAVTNLTINPNGDGTRVTLSWAGYNEAEHGDIAAYRIYRSTTGFARIDDAGVSQTGSVNAGTFTYAATGLSRNTAYYFAVVPVDQTGNFIYEVTAVAATPMDTQAPDEVRNLTVTAYADRLVFNWQPALATDLAGYKLYFDNATQPGATLTADVLTYERTGLAPATAYPFKIKATDGANDSAGVSLTGYTFLNNPTGLTATPFSGKVTLAWNASDPAAYVKHYAVYVSTTDFNGSVEGRNPALTTTGLSTQVAGLTNNTPYFFAVTAVNLSNGEKKEVTSITATPVADSQGPAIVNPLAGTTPLTEGLTLTKSLTLSLTADDPAGISRAEFLIDGALVRTDYTGPNYSFDLDLFSLSDGNHTISIAVYDTLGNKTLSVYNITVALALPAAPVITQPATGITVNQAACPVKGSAEKQTTVQLYLNDAAVGSPLAVDSQGNFAGSLTLVEGLNKLEAAAVNRTGIGPKSAAVNVTLNTAVPLAPAGLSAETRAGGTIRLSWPASAGSGVSGYNLYRAGQPFTTTAGGLKMNTGLITATQTDNLPPADGTYYYRVTAVNAAQNESELSNQATGVSDRLGPKAVAIVYTPQGRVGADGTMAPGRVNLLLTVSEALQALPFLSVTPEGGTPIAIELTKEDDLTYSGFFTITENTPTATAWAVFSGRDLYGNRGTDILSGNSIKIDTDGPAVSRLVVQPQAPIKNNAAGPVAVQMTLGLNEKVKTGTNPTLGYVLPSQGSEPISISSLNKIDTAPGDAETWQAVFTLPANAGQAGPETLSFRYTGQDELDNISHEILAANQFQVYQGNLPPLAAPTGLTAEALPGGQVMLSWKAVTNAVGYQIYRKAPGESELGSHARVNSGLEFTETVAEDGVYTYAVASIRSVNSEESESGLSTPVTVTTDATAPAAPTNLMLDLIPQGIRAQWTATVSAEPVTYAFYRAPGETTPVADATLIQEGFSQTSWIDFHPDNAQHWYFITAVDATGNESAPCAPQYLDFALLPVASITVTQQDLSLPVITWTHPSAANIDGYNLYLGPVSQGVKLNSNLLTTTTYTDVGYSGDTRAYTLTAVNDNQDSLARTLTLPKIKAVLPATARIKRGIMNRLEYQVTNSSEAEVTGITLKTALNNRTHLSATFSLAPGESRVVPVVVAGYSELPDVTPLTTTMEISPNTGETVRIIRSGEIEVMDGSLILQLFNEEFTRGAMGKVGFTLQNTGDEEIEIVTARNSGSQPSDQVTFTLLDKDNNVIATQPFKQAVGDMLVGLVNANTVARIPAGATFTSALFEMPIPATAPDQVTVRLNISTIYHHQGRTDQISMTGLSTTHQVSLVDTSYFGEITAVTPALSKGDQDITILGRAVERGTNNPLGSVKLKLVITVQGFERTYEVYTDTNGLFSYTFTPLSGEAGVYTVRAVHPDLTDKPVQGTFTIGRTTYSPALINLSLSRNYQKTINISLSTSAGNALETARLVFEPEDQPGAVLPQGVNITLGTPQNVPSSGSVNLPFTIWADNSAANTAVFYLKVLSGETPTIHGCVRINAQFLEAKPVLSFTPNHIETGVSWDNTVVESETLTNTGVADMNDVRVVLLSQNGSPAPAWVYLNSAADQGTIAVGESKKIDIAFSPVEGTTPEGIYTFLLRVISSNHPTRDIYVVATVTQSGRGKALFHLSDIYTGTLDANSDPIPGLSGAKIRLQNELVPTDIFNGGPSNTDGEIEFLDLPAGRYQYRVTAANHSEQTGRIWIKPAVTTTQEVFLDYNLVTVEWSVNEITIQDKYEITLNTTFQTDVPAAVVIAQPSATVLPKMKAGDVLNTEINLTNHGLIKADHLKFTLPTDDEHFKFEMLGGLPDSLFAKQVITVPIRVTCLSPLEPETETGGGCVNYVRCGYLVYDFICSNKRQSVSKTDYCVTYTSCSHEHTGGGQGGGSGTINVSGGGSGGTGSFLDNPAQESTPVSGSKCYPEQKSDVDDIKCEPCRNKATKQDQTQETKSEVHTRLRKYQRDDRDLSVKVPGGLAEINRYYRDGRWYMGFTDYADRSWPLFAGYMGADFHRKLLTIPCRDEKLLSEAVTIEGVIYGNLMVFSSDIALVSKYDPDGRLIDQWYDCIVEGRSINYFYRGYNVEETTDGMARWVSPSGLWRKFESFNEGRSGRLKAYGDKNGTIAQFDYDDATGRLLRMTDSSGEPIVWFEYNADNLISAFYDSAGRRVEYTYTNGHLTNVKDVNGNNTSYTYDDKGRLIRTTNPEGGESNITYDKEDGIQSVLDQNGKGHLFDFNYDKYKKQLYARVRTTSGMIKETWYNKDGDTNRVDLNGRTIKKINKDNRILYLTDENGFVTREEFDEWENKTKTVYPDGSMIKKEYEHKYNQPVSSVDENGVLTRFEYDEKGNLIRKREAIGTDNERITEYTYSTNGNVLTITQLGDADTPAALTQMTYDSAGNISTITDAEGNLTQFTSYDNMGNVLTKIDPRGKEWSYTYDAAGHMLTATDPLLNITRFFYDKVGNKVHEIDAEGREKFFEYDDSNNLVKAIDADGKITLFEYNTDNKLIKQTDPTGRIIEYHYDNEGHLVQTTDGNNNQIYMQYKTGASGCSSCSGGTGSGSQLAKTIFPTYEQAYAYDRRGRRTAESDIMGSTILTTHFAYDPVGNLTQKIDKEGNLTGYDYDELRRLTKVANATDDGTNETIYTYDDRDNLIALEDAKHQITRFEYDRNNRLTKEIRPLNQATTYHYDTAGNLDWKLDAKNQKTEYVYNDAGQLTDIKYFESGGTAPAKTVTFSYDHVGNLTGYDDGVTSATYGYDANYRKTSEATDYGTFQKTNTYEFYANGSKKTFTGPDGITYTYSYDDNNQLASVTIPNVGAITVNEYTWMRPKSMTLPGGTTKEFVYDPMMRLKELHAKDPAQNPLLNYYYEHDKMDNIKSKFTEHGNYNYNYDDLYRLTGSDNPESQADETFTYDPVGNRLTSAATSGQWAYNQNNELNSFDNVTYEYDANGNTVKKTAGGVVTSYVYNTEDRLTQVWNGEAGTGDLIASYHYDPFGRRLWKDVGSRTYFHYADEGLIGEYDGSGVEIKTYGWDPESIWGTDPLFMKVGTEYYFYQNDHLGTPQKMTTISGAVAWSAKYSSFGKAEVDPASTVTSNLRLPGQYYDQETGLHYNWFRYYDIDSDRYLSPDIINFDFSLTNYGYVSNNPSIFLDPWGLIKVKKGIDISKLKEEIKDTFDTIDDVYKYCNVPEATITSANDSKHKSGSKHYTDEAIDLRGNDVDDFKMKDISEELKQRLGKDYDIDPEFFPKNPSNDHIHIEYDTHIKPKVVKWKVKHSLKKQTRKYQIKRSLKKMTKR